jgi:hypothetical protein
MRMAIRDYFAEMYVAGILADNGWNIYFPRRDQGFDFIITKPLGDQIIVRPVQVKGKYPGSGRMALPAYGYVGALSQLHPDMVLAIAFFSTDAASVAPDHIAYMPRNQIRPCTRGYACNPAKFSNDRVEPRRDYRRYFDKGGMLLMESSEWQ